MTNRYIPGILALVFTTNLSAFPCYFTVVKDSCWTDYDVTVVATDTVSNKQVISVEVPKGKTWNRESFTCKPGQQLMYTATFKPEIWAGTENAVYKAQHYKFLPTTITAKTVAWNVETCFPKAFSEVPLPANATANCKCAEAPPVEPVPE